MLFFNEANIQSEILAVDPVMVLRAIMDLSIRVTKCVRNNGGHFKLIQPVNCAFF